MTLAEYCAKILPVQRTSPGYISRIYKLAKAVDSAETPNAVKLLGALAAKLGADVTAQNFRDATPTFARKDIWQVQIVEQTAQGGIGRCWQTNLECDLGVAFLHALVFAFELAGVKSLEEVRILEDMYGQSQA